MAGWLHAPIQLSLGAVTAKFYGTAVIDNLPVFAWRVARPCFAVASNLGSSRACGAGVGGRKASDAHTESIGWETSFTPHKAGFQCGDV